MDKKEIRSWVKFHKLQYSPTPLYRFKRAGLRLFGRDIYDYPRKYKGRPIPPRPDGGRVIEDILNAGSPSFVTRLGVVEANYLFQYFQKQAGESIDYAKPLDDRFLLDRNAGFFPMDAQLIDRFEEMLFQSAKEADVLGVWNSGYGSEEFVLRISKKQIVPIDFGCLYPGLNTWTRALKGKRVLVVHPFIDSFKKQYYGPAREHIFPGTNLLPEFELIGYKSVVSLAGEKTRFATWFDALNFMWSEISILKDSFDVCLLGCGAYGLPLAERVYKMGKIAIHIGGGLQLLFGVKGNAYASDPLFRALMNEFWIWPSQNETPKHSELVESSMYWAPKGPKSQ